MKGSISPEESVLLVNRTVRSVQMPLLVINALHNSSFRKIVNSVFLVKNGLSLIQNRVHANPVERTALPATLQSSV